MLAYSQADIEKRKSFLNELKAFKKGGRKIICLDEIGFKMHDNRAHGYAQRGKPCISQYNR
ncbi:hypothetical protein A6A20_06195 [Volucribacter amazonae]|uniref:Transposase n=1 Tax=Volucribacter amazonae TaxID=256731 RepID=A0A9X4SI46_9PAST|nr:hypothetical protein [Volucribacter amazonae]